MQKPIYGKFWVVQLTNAQIFIRFLKVEVGFSKQNLVLLFAVALLMNLTCCLCYACNISSYNHAVFLLLLS
jgi:hypothetical protein